MLKISLKITIKRGGDYWENRPENPYVNDPKRVKKGKPLRQSRPLKQTFGFTDVNCKIVGIFYVDVLRIIGELVNVV
jgi:hypothetical protein